MPTALSGQALRDSRSENYGVLLDPFGWPLAGQMSVNEATLIQQPWLEVFSGRGKLLPDVIRPSTFRFEEGRELGASCFPADAALP